MKRPLCFICFSFLVIILLITKYVILPDDLDEGYHTVIGIVIDKQEGKSELELYLRHVVILDNVKSYETALEQYEVKLSENTQTIIAYVSYEGEQIPKIGSTVLLKGKLQSFSRATNYGAFDLNSYRRTQGYSGMIGNGKLLGMDQSKATYKESLYQFRKWCGTLFNTCLPEKEAGILKAMILGEKEDLDQSIKSLYAKNGIIHVIAISGLHISLIGMCFYQMLGKSRLSIGYITIMTVIFVYLYLQMTGMTSSGMRAFIMFSIYLLGKYVKRTYDMMTAMSVAYVVVMLGNPYAWEQVGMLLSFGAIFAIACFSFVLEGMVIEPLRISVAIQLITFPVIANMYYEYPLTSILINFLIVPSVGLLVGMGIGILIVGKFLPMIASMLGVLITAILKGYEGICNLCLYIPYQSIPIAHLSTVKLMLYYGLMLGVIYLARKYLRKKKVRLFFLIAAIGIVLYQPQNSLRITMIDVGQGDGILIQTPTNHAYLIDGGSTTVSKVGEYAIIPTLKYYGIRKIDGVFLTHMDRDHISGVCELLEAQRISGEFQIKKIFLGSTVNTEEAPELFGLIEACDVEIQYLEYPDILMDGKITFQIFMPYEGYVAENENENSLVMSLSYKNFDILLTGDMEKRGETCLLEQIKNQKKIDYEVLKVGHHGSKNATSAALLQEITAEYGIISCGRHNTYGHPHKEALDRMELSNMEWYETDQGGAIVVETDGIKYEIFSYSKKSTN